MSIYLTHTNPEKRIVLNIKSTIAANDGEPLLDIYRIKRPYLYARKLAVIYARLALINLL